MKKCIYLLIIISLSLNLGAQFSKNDSLFVGKRGNVIWDRKINVFNLGNEKWTSYYRIYFKKAGDSDWQKVGRFGKNIYPHLSKSEEVLLNYNTYKAQKKQSYVLLSSAIGILTGWTLYTAYELNRTNDITVYLKPIPIAMLVGFEVCFYLGKRKNTKGDLYLIQAIRKTNSK